MLALKTQNVPALDRAFTILELLAKSKTGLTLRDLVLETGLAKSSVHCLLVTLQRRGYLHQNERTRRYMFGLRLFSFANMALGGTKLREQGAPFLQALMEKARLTVHMAILDHQEAVVVAKYEPPGISRMATWIGKRADVHCTSLGKALVAYLPEQELERIIKEHSLSRHNENTLCSRRKLMEDLARTAQRGYAIDDEEDELGWRCVGAPIFSRDGQAVASVSISGTTAQITSENMAQLAELVVDTARSISSVLVCCSTESF